MRKRFDGKHILLGVTGSIAAYKSCEVLRILQRYGAEIKVVMTQSAKAFIAPLTFETLSGYEVVTELFPPYHVVRTRHVSLAEWAHCLLICPATANIIGKVASGIADDFLSTVVMASRAPVVFAPAMDYEMVRHPVYFSNCEKLQKLGYRFVKTEKGDLASGAVGQGRLASFDSIIDQVKEAVFSSNQLKGTKILVTAGPTVEPIDPVRFLSNRSSGKMGYTIAEEAALRGADVTLISGPTSLHPYDGLKTINIQTAEEMRRAVVKEWSHHQVLIMAAAVADFHPEKTAKNKIKKENARETIKFERTVDILSEISDKKGMKITVGFALETENEIENARKKMHNKNLDFICLNNPFEKGAVFGTDTNKVSIIDEKSVESLPLMPKWEVARKICDKVQQLLRERVTE